MISLERDAIIGDRYCLCRPLGEGGMGWVWEARDVVTHAPYALKFLKRDKEADRRRFQREVRAAAAVRHANVIDVHDFVELADGTLVMVMALLAGEALGAALRREKRIALPDLAAILLPVTSALEATHTIGIIHRDLKPDNIFLSKEGDEIVVKVLDFGAAKLTATEGFAASTGAEALTNTGSMVGTPYYMSPEQVFSEKDLDARADIWSLGVVMYECLCGSRPTEADTVGQVLKRIMKADFPPIATRCEGLPDDVASMITRMLSADRETRPRDMREVQDVLARHAATRLVSFPRSPGDEPVDPRGETHPVSGPSAEGVEIRPRREAVTGAWLRRRKGVAALGALALVSGVVAVLAARSEHRETSPAVAAPPTETVAAEDKPATTAAEVAPVVAVALAGSVPAPALPLVSATSIAKVSPPRMPIAASAAPRMAISGASPVSSAPSSVWTER